MVENNIYRKPALTRLEPYKGMNDYAYAAALNLPIRRIVNGPVLADGIQVSKEGDMDVTSKIPGATIEVHSNILGASAYVTVKIEGDGSVAKMVTAGKTAEILGVTIEHKR